MLLVGSCSSWSKKSETKEPKRVKSFESITVGERGGLTGLSSLYRLLDNGAYLSVNTKGSWDTLGRVKEQELKQAEQMLQIIKGLENRSLGDGDGSTKEYKVEANLKPDGYVYYLWPEDREKVPQELKDFYAYILSINPRP